jgi:acetyltransferase-like isoleucine patch superfamily enzyme
VSIVAKIRRGEGPVWGRAKRLAKAGLAFHLPVNAMTRPIWKVLYGVHVSIREGWIWTRRFFWNEPLFRSQCESVGAGFQLEELPYLIGRGKIDIGDGVRLSGKSSFAFNNRHAALPTLTLGDATFLGHGCSIRVASSVMIGRYCLIAGGVTIADYDGHPLAAVRRRANETSAWKDVKPVKIGDDVWIGVGALILKGVTIGDRSIVAAHAVVTKDVPADCVVAGNPAVVVKRLVAGG